MSQKSMAEVGYLFSMLHGALWLLIVMELFLGWFFYSYNPEIWLATPEEVQKSIMILFWTSLCCCGLAFLVRLELSRVGK